MRKGTVVAEVGAAGTDQDAVINPVVGPDADAEGLPSPDAEEGAVLDEHNEPLS